MAPPTAPTKSRGKVSKNAITPIATGERETCHTNQLCATFCMKSPELETSAPSKRRRKFRCFRDRRVRKLRRRCMFERCYKRLFLRDCTRFAKHLEIFARGELYRITRPTNIVHSSGTR